MVIGTNKRLNYFVINIKKWKSVIAINILDHFLKNKRKVNYVVQEMNIITIIVIRKQIK